MEVYNWYGLQKEFQLICLTNYKLFVDIKHGTIGNDLVIRPVPASVTLQNNQYLNYNLDDDDEMFLDEDEAIESAKRLKQDNSNSTTNSKIASLAASQLPSGSNTATNSGKLDNRENTHVIYKRNMFNPESHSDFCKFLLFSITYVLFIRKIVSNQK